MPPTSSVPTSNSLWSPLDTVKDVSESLGISNLPNDVANVLAMDIEYRIFQIIEQALKFMRHSKRKTLSTKDINKALKVLNVEPLYGYNVSKPLNFKQALVGPGQTLYYIDDNQVDLEKLINSPLPKISRLVTFTAHWLAIEGVQPNIPQNPTLSEIKNLPVSERGSMQNMILNSNSVLEENVESATGTNDEINGGTGADAALKSKLFENKLKVKPLIKHVISKELQLYFNKIVQVLTSSPENNPEFEHLKNSALVSLRSDPGLHQLVPYFIQFISETITNNLNNISLLHIVLESIYSLLLNDNIFLDPYIHSLSPCILTLLLAKRIGKSPFGSSSASNENIENWLDETLAIREFSASLLDHILKNYSSNYNTLKPRVARTLLKAFLQSNINLENENVKTKELKKLYVKNLLLNFGSYYGAIIGIRKLGNEIIRLLLIGNVKLWSEFIFYDEIDKSGQDGADKDEESDEDVKMGDNDEVNGGSLTDVMVQQEKEILTKAVIDALRDLKGNETTKALGKDDGVVDEASKEKLKERLGEHLANELLKEKDAKSIVEKIFFGDLS